MCTILIVDDFRPFRDVVHQILSTRPDLCVIGEASDGLAAVQQAESLKPDIILLDVGLPKLNGMVTARQILKGRPNTKILFVSSLFLKPFVDEAFRIGACGYIDKTEVGTELIRAIDVVLNDGRYQPDLRSDEVV